MKYTSRLKGMIEAIGDIERAIETNQKQMTYHESNMIDQNGEVVRYHADEIEKYEATILVLETALEYIMEIDVRRLHEFDEYNRAEKKAEAILYEVEE